MYVINSSNFQWLCYILISPTETVIKYHALLSLFKFKWNTKILNLTKNLILLIVKMYIDAYIYTHIYVCMST